MLSIGVLLMRVLACVNSSYEMTVQGDMLNQHTFQNLFDNCNTQARLARCYAGSTCLLV